MRNQKSHLKYIVAFLHFICIPVDGGWATWEEWYACPVTCGTGTHYRYRDCSNPLVYCDGADCPNCDGSYCSQSIQRDKDTNTCNDFACNGKYDAKYLINLIKKKGKYIRII